MSKNMTKDEITLKKNGLKEYEVIEAPDALYYVDYTLKKFAIKDRIGFNVYKFKEFNEYEIVRGNLKNTQKLAIMAQLIML